jgi:hypothetical protein
MSIDSSRSVHWCHIRTIARGPGPGCQRCFEPNQGLDRERSRRRSTDVYLYRFAGHSGYVDIRRHHVLHAPAQEKIDSAETGTCDRRRDRLTIDRSQVLRYWLVLHIILDGMAR